jgi:signal transduction histidine kinase/CheY-like chemotaxis protein
MPDGKNRKLEEFRKQQATMELLLGSGLWDYYPQKDTFLFNEAASRMLGLGEEPTSVTTEDVLRLLVPDDRDVLKDYLNGMLSGRIIRTDLDLLPDPSRNVRNIAIGGLLTDDADRRIAGVIQDITLRRRKEDELTHSREKAEEADRMKTVFLTNLSHELRTPMNTIIGFSELINIGNIPPEKRKEYSRIIRFKGQELLTLIDDIIEVSKFEAGHIKFVSNPCELNHLLGEVYQIAIERRKAAQKEGLGVNLNLPPAEINLLTDPGRVQQVFINLIDNSLKFTERGSIEIGYEVKDSRTIQCFVKDTGIGLKKEELKNLFNRFKKIEETSFRKNTGSGLGLTISKYIVQLLGGKIWVDSVYGEGSTFFFTIPNNPPSQPDSSTDMVKEKEDQAEYNWKNKVILLVEDDDINVQFFEAILSPYQVQVIHASNGLQGVELCRSIPHIDLVLMDVKMPEMNGHDACREIKKLRPSLPIIAQTAFALQEERQKCMEAGCDDYVSKPININELLGKIQQLIS